MKVIEIEKLNQLVSRNDMTGNEKVEWLTDFIDKYVTEQLRLNDVSQRSELLPPVCPSCLSYEWSYHSGIDQMKCLDCGNCG